MNKKILTFIIIICLLTLGCRRIGPGASPEEGGVIEEIYRGNEGLRMDFMQDAPPREIYDEGTLNMIVELENRGTYDLSGSNCMLHLSGYDNTIIRTLDPDQFCGDYFEGKSTFNPEGGYSTVEFTSDYIKLPQGTDVYEPNFLVSACYRYKTIANPEVCIDPSLYSLSAIQKACLVRDVSVGGGQGAPVAVTRVDVDMLKDKVQFTIYVSNVGGSGGRGRVLRPGVSITGQSAHSCPYNLDYDDINIVDYSVDFRGGSLLRCSPTVHGLSQARLINDQAKIVCLFTTSGEEAYVTPLQIELDYTYLDSIEEEVRIIKTPE